MKYINKKLLDISVRKTILQGLTLEHNIRKQHNSPPQNSDLS